MATYNHKWVNPVNASVPPADVIGDDSNENGRRGEDHEITEAQQRSGSTPSKEAPGAHRDGVESSML